MMDGYTLNDLIFHRDFSLTEDEVVAYVAYGMIGPYEWPIGSIRFSGPMVLVLRPI